MENDNKWQVQDAKNKFSELLEEAHTTGPQVITRRGVETAVLLSYADYNALARRQSRLSEFLRDSPLVYDEIDLSRDKSPLRPDVEI